MNSTSSIQYFSGEAQAATAQTTPSVLEKTDKKLDNINRHQATSPSRWFHLSYVFAVLCIGFLCYGFFVPMGYHAATKTAADIKAYFRPAPKTVIVQDEPTKLLAFNKDYYLTTRDATQGVFLAMLFFIYQALCRLFGNP